MYKYWNAPELVGFNRLPGRVDALPYDNVKKALEDKRENAFFYSLNGEWDFKFFDKLENVDKDFVSKSYNFDKIPVPSCYTMKGYDHPHYTNVQMPFFNFPSDPPKENSSGLYRRVFSLPKEHKNRRLVLYLGGVESACSVHINGEFVGIAKDSKMTSEFDVSEFVKFDQENDIRIHVIRYSDASYIEDQDHFWQAGIYRDVFIYSTQDTYIRDFFAKSFNYSSDYKSCDLEFVVEVKGKTPQNTVKVEVKTELFDLDGNLILSKTTNSPLGLLDQKEDKIGLRFFKTLMRVENPKLWSNETPNVYKIVVSIYDEDKNLIECQSDDFGFKEVKIKEGILKINGKRVVIKGVNRHEFDSKEGKNLTHELMEEDVILAKKFNFNAIRTSHYPTDPYFYRMCNKHGIFVIDEANIEAHANYWSIVNDRRYELAFFDRITRTVLRDKNQPCIFAWSLGNESGSGPIHDACYEWIKRYDPTRIVSSEGNDKNDFEHHHTVVDKKPSSDLICPMYPWISWVVDLFENHKQLTKPFIMIEYAHSMGNSTGGLSDYFELFDRYPGAQGGFIWDMIDQGIEKTDDKGVNYYGYGGDFNDFPNDKNFCINGLFSPDRTPHPAAYEFKFLAREFDVRLKSLKNSEFIIKNKMFFSNFKDYCKIEYYILENGISSKMGELTNLDIKAGEEKTVVLNLKSENKNEHNFEKIVEFRFLLKGNSTFASEGFEIFRQQITLEKASNLNGIYFISEDDDKFVLLQNENEFEFKSKNSSVFIKDGLVYSIKKNNQELLNSPIMPHFSTALTDDGQANLQKWNDLGVFDIISSNVSSTKENDTLKIVNQISNINTGFHLILKTTIKPKNSSLHFYHSFDVKTADLPRIGFYFSVDKSFQNTVYYGLGPHENYPDRLAGARKEIYKKSIDDFYFNYIKPQETGNMMNTRYLKIKGQKAELDFEFVNESSFSILPYSQDTLFSNDHTNTLKKSEFPYVHIDAFVRGLGTLVCGPDTLEKFRSKKETYELEFYLK